MTYHGKNGHNNKCKDKQNINVYDGENKIVLEAEGLTSFLYWYSLLIGVSAISDQVNAKR